MTVRLRVDGLLREVQPPPPKSLYRGIVTRIKILSDMDIAERRLPLDGRFKFKGVLDEVYVFETALTPAQIYNLYRYNKLAADLAL